MKKIKTILFIITLFVVSTLFVPKIDARVVTAQEFADRLKGISGLFNLSNEDFEERIKVNGNIIEEYDPSLNKVVQVVDCSDGTITYDSMGKLINDDVVSAAIIQEVFRINSDNINNTFSIIGNNFDANGEVYNELNNIIDASKKDQDAFFDNYGFVRYNDDETNDQKSKFSLDIDKWDMFFSKTHVLNPRSLEYEKNKLTPTIKVSETDSKSVKLELEVTDPAELATSLEKKCFVYRSTEEDGLYRRIQEEPIDCSKTITITDSGLNPSTTYYYKARLAYTIEYSPILTVKTNTPMTTTTEKKESTTKIITNPKTGDKITFWALLEVSCIVAAVIALKKVKKLNSLE